MIKRAVLKYVFAVVSVAAMCAAEFSGLRPCGAGYAAALLYCGVPAIVVIPSFVAFSLAFDFSLTSLIYALSVSVAAFTAALAATRFKRAKKPLFAVLLFAAHAALLTMRNKIGLLPIFVWAMLGMGIFVSAVCFLTPIFLKKLRYNFLETELVSGAVLLICAAEGLCGIRIGGFDAAYLLTAFFIPFAAAVGSLSGAVAVGMCFGCGIAVYTLSPLPIAFTAFSALVTSVFARAPRPLPSLSAAAAYILVSYLFAAPPSWQQTVCFAVGSIAFALFPPRVLARVHDTLFAPVTAAAARGVIGRVASETGNSLLGASRIFDDMKTAMEQVPDYEGESVLERKVCSRCGRYTSCSAVEGFGEALSKMEHASAVKGRASVSEIPSILSMCDNLSALIAGATDAAQTRHAQHITAEAKREGRKIVAQQLGLMSGVLRQLGERVKTPARFDGENERKIATELAYRGAAVPEVIVTSDTISVVMRSDDMSGDATAEAISKVMRSPYRFIRGSADVLPGYTMMVFGRAPRYDVAFSVASVAKEERSGDNHSFIHLGGDRFMMALCDGMGSGEEAEKASETAIELVESFFKAGLGSVSAVECVNRFLALNECERFSTLDITVIDLNSGDAEIIKLSSPATVIKSSDGVCAVSGSALPMGVLENVKCGRVAKVLKAGDEIIMATDGVTEALGSTEKFVTAAAMQNTADPQIEAKNILECAVAMQNGKLRDDGTVLCARIFEKNCGA